MKKFELGDRVFSYALQEWGTVEERKKVLTSNIIIVHFDVKGYRRRYEEDGRLLDDDVAPDLFYDEVEITLHQDPYQI